MRAAAPSSCSAVVVRAARALSSRARPAAEGPSRGRRSAGKVLAARSRPGAGEDDAAAAMNGGASSGAAARDEEDEEVTGVAAAASAADTRVQGVELHVEASESYVSYAMSVIVGRALPDVRDGLKPVHRRILYAMHELGLSSKKPFRKCARVVGEVLGKYHPHGDSAVYEALVRMAQSFSLRSPLVNGHGNFGSLDDDPPAAMRYTECRLQVADEPLAESMLLADIAMSTVNFTPNFDGSVEEPVVLPARLPNLLINGSQGIAVGMATSIPPHNLGEVVDALCALIDNPNATVQELMEFCPAPDFPTGGQIMGTDSLLSVYSTGHGSITVRGKAHIEQVGNGRTSRSVIIINEIPYQASKANLVERIADLVNSKQLEGVSDIRDESDRSGTRVVVEVKRGAMAPVLLNNLYKLTTLQTRFNCNMVGLINSEPRELSLKDFLKTFLDFRCDVVKRRAEHHLKHAQDRDNIVQGLLVALDNLDSVVAHIRAAQDSAGASAVLQREYALNGAQCDAVLGMPLRRLTALESKKFLEEHERLAHEIDHLKNLLSDHRRVLQVVEKEALALKKEFHTPRRTELISQQGEIREVDVVPNDEILVTLSERGYVKRMQSDSFAAQNRKTIGKSLGKLRENDAMAKCFICRSHDHVLFFSDRGVVYSLRAYQLPEGSRLSTGSPLIQILPLVEQEKITSVLPVKEFLEDQYLVMLTVNGYIKRTSLSAFSSEPGDELRWVRLAMEADSLVVASQQGNIIRYLSDQLRPVKRVTRGVRAMSLHDGDKIAAMDIIPASAMQSDGGAPCLLVVTESGYGKRVPVDSFSNQQRGGKGVIGTKFALNDDTVVAVRIVGSARDDSEGEEDVVFGSEAGRMARLRVRDIPIQKTRAARGVLLMKLDEGDKVTAVSIIPAGDLVEEDSQASSSIPASAPSAVLADVVA
eukprot:SM000253S09048  [mRNA]  locus=s253:104707:113051:- [translate_table: standard]